MSGTGVTGVKTGVRGGATGTGTTGPGVTTPAGTRSWSSAPKDDPTTGLKDEDFISNVPYEAISTIFLIHKAFLLIFLLGLCMVKRKSDPKLK